MFAYKPFHFSFPLNAEIHKTSNLLHSLCPRCGEQSKSHPLFILHRKLSKITLAYITELIKLQL